MDLRNRSRILKASMNFFLLFLLVLMPISVVSSSSDGENGTISVTLDNVVDLPRGGRALEGQVLALGSECGALDQVLPLALMESTDMSSLGRGTKLNVYEITNRTPVHAMIQQINALGLQCEGSPNFLVFTAGSNSVFGSPFSNDSKHMAPIGAIANQPALHILQPSNSFTGQGVTVVLFDTSCFPEAGNWPLPQPFGSIKVHDDYTVPIEATFELLSKRPSNEVNLCSHAEGVASLTKVIAPNTSLKLYPVLGDNGFGALSGLLNALNDFLSSNPSAGSTVVNLSLGVDAGPNGSNMLKTILAEVHDQGTVIIAAAGNFAEDQPQFPASLSFVIAVGATHREGSRTNYTNLGDLYAPGGEGRPCSTYLESDYDPSEHDCIAVFNSLSRTGASWAQGTSFATPFVSGLAALLWQADSANNILDPTAVKLLIEDGANHVIDIDKTLNECLQNYPNPC